MHDVFLEVLDVLLERDGRNNSKPAAHPAANRALDEWRQRFAFPQHSLGAGLRLGRDTDGRWVRV
jgi:hypothetical protein